MTVGQIERQWEIINTLCRRNRTTLLESTSRKIEKEKPCQNVLMRNLLYIS